MEDYFEAKLSLLKMSPVCVVNLDNEYTAKIPELLPNKEIITFGVDNKADIMAKMLQNPTDKYNEKLQNKLTPEEEKLVAMLASGTACSIPNLNELIKQVPDIMPSQQTK